MNRNNFNKPIEKKKKKKIKKPKRYFSDDRLSQNRYTTIPAEYTPPKTEPTTYITYEQFVQEIEEYIGSIRAVNWLTYLNADSVIMRQFYDRVSLQGQNYTDAGTFVLENIRPLTSFIWQVFEYVDIDDAFVNLSDFSDIANWFIEDYYSRYNINEAPAYNDDELDRVLDSKIFQDYYTELYANGYVKDVLQDEIDEAKEDEEHIDDRDIISSSDIGDFPSFYQWLKDRTNKGYWEENEDLARQIYEAVLKVPDDPNAIDDDPFGDWYTANEDKLKRLYDGEISDDLDEYGNLNNGYQIEQPQTSSQSNKIYFDKDFYYYATPISGYWDGGKIVLDAGYIKQHFPNLYYDLIEQGATEEETMLSYVGYNSKGIPGDLYTTGLMLPENLGNSFLYIYLYSIYDNIDTSSTLGANLKKAIENGYVNNLLENDPAYFDLINEVSQNDGYNELEGFANSYNELRQSGYTTAEIIDYMTNNLGDEATIKNIENYLSSKEEYDQNDTYDKDFTELEKLDNELKEAIDKKNNVTNNAAQALVDKYQDPLYVDSDPNDPSDTAKKLADELANKQGDKTEIRQLQETAQPPLGGDNPDNVQVQPSLPDEKRDITLSEGLYAIIYGDKYQVMQINADKSAKLIGFMTRQQMTDKYKPEDNITILTDEEYDDAYNKMVYGTDPGEIEPVFPPYDPTLKEYITPDDISNFEEFYAFLQQDNETYWNYKQDEVQQIYDNIIDDGGDFASWYNDNQGALDILYNDMGNYEVDENGNFAEAIKRNPATIGDQWLYFNNDNPALDGVSDNQIYYIVVDDKTQLYVYDSVNNVFRQTALDYKGDVSYYNEINESNFKDYTFLPDELYRNFEPTPEDMAKDKIGEQYVVPQDIGDYNTFYTFLKQDNQYWVDNPDKAKQIYDAIIESGADDPDAFSNWYISNQDELDKIYNSISDYDIDESGNFIPKTGATTDPLPDTSFDQGDYNKFVININRNVTLTELTEQYEMGGGDIDTIYRNIYDVYVANQDNYSKINFVNDYASLITNIQDYMTLAGGTPTNAQLIQLVQQYTDNHGIVYDEANLTNQDGLAQVVLPDATTSTKPTLFDPSAGYYQPTIGTIYAIIQKDGKGYEIIQRLPDQDGDGMTDDNLLGSNLSADDLNKQYPGSTIVTADDWNKMTSSTETQPEITGDTGRKLSDYTPGLYGVQNDDGTYSIVSISDDGTITQQGANIDADKFSQRQGIIGTITEDDYNELLEPDTDINEPGEIELNPDGSIVTPTIDDATVSNSRINNDINVMQQTDNIGPVELKIKQTVSDDPRIQAMHDAGVLNVADEDDFYEYGPNKLPFHRLDYTNERLTNKEYELIKDSFEYDRDITKPFTIDQAGVTYSEEFKTQYVNEHEYFFMLSKNNQEFYDWLDMRKSGEESRSYIAYSVNQKIEASNIDIASYLKYGKISQLMRGVDYKPNTNNSEHSTRQAILDIGELGNNNTSAFILSASSSCMFSIMIMENIKKIADTVAISQFDSAINSGDFKKLDDIVFSGMYPKGSIIRNSIETNAKIDKFSKNILTAIFSERNYKTLKDVEINNRYSYLITNFFGKTEDRINALNNNSGKVLFNLALVYLSYYSSFLNNTFSLGINTDPKTNMLEITSTFLEVVYPATEYDAELVRSIDNLVSLFINEIRGVGHGVTNTGESDLMMNEVINRVLDLVLDISRPDIMIEEYIEKNTLESIIKNFGSEVFRGTRTREGLVKFLIDGLIDTTSYLETSRKMMMTVLGPKFENIDNTVLFDCLVMNELQANIFLNNPKYNLILPMLKPAIIGIVPERKIDVTMVGFNVPIRGLLLKAVKLDVLPNIIDEDVKKIFHNPENEPRFPSRQYAEDRIKILNDLGGNFDEPFDNGDGTFSVGPKEKIEPFYEDQKPDDIKLPDKMYQNFQDAEFDEKGRLVLKTNFNEVCKILEDVEYFETVDFNKIEIPEESTDWVDASLVEFANKNYDTDNDKLKDKFLDIFYNWKDDAVYVEATDDKSIISVKNDDKNELIMLFRGSQNMRDWGINMADINSALRVTKLLSALYTPLSYFSTSVASKGLGMLEKYLDLPLKGHQGFMYSNYMATDWIKKLLDTRVNNKTKIKMVSHSKGNSIGQYALYLASEQFKDIKYRSFGGVNWMNKESAETFEVATALQDIRNYYNTNDALNYINSVTPYFPVGNNYLIDRQNALDIFTDHMIDTYKTNLLQSAKMFVPYREKRDAPPMVGFDLMAIGLGAFKETVKFLWYNIDDLSLVFGGPTDMLGLGLIAPIIPENNNINEMDDIINEMTFDIPDDPEYEFE